MLTKQLFTFLSELKEHNTKEWFDLHRNEYESVRAGFKDFTEIILKESQKFDPQLAGLEVKNCMFRINRDIRFSKNKDPYKNNFACSFTQKGKKSLYAGYYFHLEPGSIFAGGGIYGPEPDVLKAVRNEIYFHYDEFTAITKNKSFAKHYKGLDHIDSLKSVPKGFEAEHPSAEILKNKHFVCSVSFTEVQVLGKDFASLLLDSFEAMTPFIHFLNRAVDNR